MSVHIDMPRTKNQEKIMKNTIAASEGVQKTECHPESRDIKKKRTIMKAPRESTTPKPSIPAQVASEAIRPG